MTTKQQDLIPYVIVPFGGPGTGKSNICNFFINGKESDTFKASDATTGSETRTVKSAEAWALGDQSTKKKVKVYDVPGFGASDLPLEELAGEIMKTIGPKEKIDVVLLIINIMTPRLGLEQIISAKAIGFLEALNPENIFIVFTFCDCLK